MIMSFHLQSSRMISGQSIIHIVASLQRLITLPIFTATLLLPHLHLKIPLPENCFPHVLTLTLLNLFWKPTSWSCRWTNSSVSSIVLCLKDSQSPTMTASVSCGMLHLHAMQKWASAEYWLTIPHWQSVFQVQFKKEVISVLHRDQEHNFDVWYRPLWDWACDLLKDPHLGPHFVFDAQWLYKFDGQDFVHFFDEPWTANAFWDSQVCTYATKFECSNNVNACFIVILAEGWRKALCFHYICW
jgi:hypothetical protein